MRLFSNLRLLVQVPVVKDHAHDQHIHRRPRVLEKAPRGRAENLCNVPRFLSSYSVRELIAVALDSRLLRSCLAS
jgi:hypothetical protein